MHILTLTNTSPRFYPLLGPFLARREIIKELGGPLYDEDGKQWFIALTPGGQVAGFASMLLKKEQVVHLCEAYVVPAYRHQGLHQRLIDVRLAHCPAGTTVEVLVCSASLHQYQSRGFAVKRLRGKTWMDMTKTIGA